MQRIIFVSTGDVKDYRLWSGTIKSLYDSLLKRYRVEPLVFKRNIFIKVLEKILQHIPYCLRKLGLLLEKGIYSISFNNKIKRLYQKDDIFFIPVGSFIISFCKFPSDAKIIYLTDATYHLMQSYYWNNGRGYEYIANIAERNSLNKANNIICASNWVRKDAISYYKINPKKLYVILFGPNIRYKKKIDKTFNRSKIEMLFVGVDWERKGVDIAIKTCDLLNQQGVYAVLHVVGLNNIKGIKNENIIFHGRLSKNNSNEYRKLVNLYKNANLFILPTKAECAGIVFCEAAVFSLPIVTYNTGGISDYVINGKNGITLQEGSDEHTFCDKIKEIMKDEKTYLKYSNESRFFYENILNWNHWLDGFSKVVK